MIATASGKNDAFLRKLGASEVIDYTRTRFEDVVHDADAVLDTIGGDTQKRSWGVLKPGGVLASIVGIGVLALGVTLRIARCVRTGSRSGSGDGFRR